MKVVFSNISNGNHGDLQANEANGSGIQASGFKPKIKYARQKAEQDAYKDQSSQEVFASLINASNCANVRDEKVLDGYLTFAPDNVMRRKCL
jgi:hypothetical protein